MAVNTGYSTYAAYLSSVNSFKTLQTSLAQLSQQLNTGKKSSDLTTYGVETQRLVDLRAEIARRQGYVEAIKSASTDVKAYDRVLSSVEDINSTMLQAFTAPNSDPPTKQQHTVTFDGDLGDTGDIYKLTVDGVLFTYVTNGTEGSFDEIAGNLANQINNHVPPVRATASVSGERLVVTGTEAGPLFNVTATNTNIAGGNTNAIDASLTRAGKISPIVAQVSTALTELHALLNEQVNDRYLFGGINANEKTPVVDLSRLPDPSGSKNAASGATTTQVAAGTIRQVMRVTTDSLGQGQNETITVNGTPLVFNGPLTQQQLAAAMAAAVGPLANVSVQDIDATGFTIMSDTPGIAFTADITGNDPTPSTTQTVQANVPIGASQTDIISLSGPVGTIGEVYSVTITDPPAHASPVTISYRTTGDEPDLSTIVDKLVSKIANYQPPFGVTATNLGNGQLQLTSATAFTSHAAVQNTPTVETTQRTVVPVAQEDEIGFPGSLDAGDQYTMTFTAPVGGPFTITTAATDDEASIAAKFVSAINAAGIGVTAAVRNGKLSITSDAPGSALAYTATLSTDAGPNVTAAPTTSTTVANIPAGPLPQIDTVQLSGPVGRKGDTYEVTVNGRTVRYTTTGNEADMDAIAINLTAIINAQVPPFPASAVPGPTGSGQLVLTGATIGVELKTEAKVAQPNAVPDPTPTPYNVHQEPTDSALAWQRSSIVIADNVSIKYTFSANEVAFQKLTLALRYAQSAVDDPDNYADKMTIAKQLATESLAGVRGLESDNTVNDALFSATTLSHQTTINANVADSDKIEAVDPNEVAAKLQAVETQLQASFGAYAQTSKLSLINFIV
jgi:flagellin-like hook-associated protein FlgL